jgi:hypothetical protein
MVLIMNSVDIKDILRFCDYLDKNGDYAFSDQILNRIASNSKNIKTASNKKMSSQEKHDFFVLANKYISYRLAEDEGRVSPSIIDQINKRENPIPPASGGVANKVKDKVKDIVEKRKLLTDFFIALKNMFPKFSSQLSSASNTVSRLAGPVIGAIFLVPNAYYWFTRISQEGKEAYDSYKEKADLGSFLAALAGTISLAFAGASAAPTAGTGTVAAAALTTFLYAVSAALTVAGFALGFTEKDDPYDNLPANKKPKKEEAKPSEAPKQNTSTPPSKPSAPSSTSAPSAPRRQPSKPAENDSDKIWYDKVNKNIKDIVFD